MNPYSVNVFVKKKKKKRKTLNTNIKVVMCLNSMVKLNYTHF